MKQSVEVRILGQTYSVRGDGEGSAQVQSIAEVVNRKIEEVRGAATALAPHALAVLAALNLAEELLQVQESKEALERDVRERVGRILRTLDTMDSRRGSGTARVD